MSTAVITQELFKNMNYDTQYTTSTKPATSGDKDETSKPSAMIVFAKSDINAAIYHLSESLKHPFETKAIATVIVQESIKEDFIEKLLKQLQPYEAAIVNNNQQYLKALETAKKLNAKVVTIETPFENVVYPTLVCDFTHDQFGTTTFSGIVTLHAFRTAKEAASLVNKESLKFTYTSIWHENHSYAYELVAAIKSQIYYFNCFQVPMTILEENIAKGNSAFVAMDKSYHYETLQCDGVQKSIVFPVGSIFAN